MVNRQFCYIILTFGKFMRKWRAKGNNPGFSQEISPPAVYFVSTNSPTRSCCAVRIDSYFIREGGRSTLIISSLVVASSLVSACLLPVVGLIPTLRGGVRVLTVTRYQRRR